MEIPSASAACDRDPAMLRRLAKEISARTGLVVIAVGLRPKDLAHAPVLRGLGAHIERRDL